MSGFLVIIGSIIVYDMVITERENSWRLARMYQKQKSKVEELKRTIRCMKKSDNNNYNNNN